MQETFRAIITEMGGTPMTPMPTAAEGYGIEAGGRIIHEVGVTRMGNDPSTSVLNKNCQAHDCQERVRRRRRAVRVAGRQELHVDDPRAGDADGGVHRRAAEGRDGLTESACRCQHLERTEPKLGTALNRTGRWDPWIGTCTGR